MASENDVDHPKHYNSHPSGVECIEIVEHYNFNVGNAIKYMWRAGLKPLVRPDGERHGTEDAALVDLRKAAWYIHREIERRSKNGAD